MITQSDNEQLLQVRPHIERYRALMERWNTHSNLISKTDLMDAHVFYQRHVLDCAQLITHIQGIQHVADIGTGAGFPGVILALLFLNKGQNQTVHLIESRSKRVLFLEDVKRALNLSNVIIHHSRIEEMPPLSTPLFVSRAFRSLKDTLPLLETHIQAKTCYITLKGESWEEEIIDAQRAWHFDLAVFPSLTHSKSRILHVSNITRRL